MDEVCEPPPPSSASAEAPSQVLLVAGPAGLRAGQEVTISYGSQWPNEAFLLLFGFAPEGNPADAVVLFPSLADLAAAWLRFVNPAQATVPLLSEAGYAPVDELMHSQPLEYGAGEALLGTMLSQPALAQGMASGDYERLLVTAQGVDGRMAEAIALVAAAAVVSGSGAEASSKSLGEMHYQRFLLSACLERKRIMSEAAVGKAAALLPVATQFRDQKLSILESAINSLSD